MSLLYNLFIWTYNLTIGLASLFNHKAALWVKGRKDIFNRIEYALSGEEQRIWFHCAGLGEFEQGRPLIEKIKKEHPSKKIFLTFFSPSGYEVRKDYEYADYIFYLPSDSPSNAKRLIKLVKPEMVIFVKYEFWFNYFKEIRKNDLPLYLISGVFRSEQHFFQKWGGWQKKQLKNISYFYLQDDKSNDLLRINGFTNTMVSGDTRFDRVSEILIEKTSFPIIEKFKNNEKVLCAGSSWPPDEDIILSYLKTNSKLKLIIAPHDISKGHIDEIKNKFKSFELIEYSQAKDIDISNKQILIIDSIGLLNKIYFYADIAYIGGGFGVAIHNLLEPAVYGIPVIYGPKHKNFREAIEMADGNGGFPIENKEDFNEIMRKFQSNEDFYKTSSRAAADYIKKNTGSTELIFKKII